MFCILCRKKEFCIMNYSKEINYCSKCHHYPCVCSSNNTGFSNSNCYPSKTHNHSCSYNDSFNCNPPKCCCKCSCTNHVPNTKKSCCKPSSCKPSSCKKPICSCNKNNCGCKINPLWFILLFLVV